MGGTTTQVSTSASFAHRCYTCCVGTQRYTTQYTHTQACSYYYSQAIQYLLKNKWLYFLPPSHIDKNDYFPHTACKRLNRRLDIVQLEKMASLFDSCTGQRRSVGQLACSTSMISSQGRSRRGSHTVTVRIFICASFPKER